MGTRGDHGAGAGNEAFVHVLRAQRHIGAILAVENQRELVLIANAEQHQRGQPLRVGEDAGDVDALLHQFLAQETAHMLVANLGQQRRTQAQPRGARCHIGGGAADVFLETAHILQTATDLRAVKVNGRTPDGDEVQILGHYTVPPSEPSSCAIS